MRVIVWGQEVTKESLESAKRIAGKDTVSGAILNKDKAKFAPKVKDILVYVLNNETSVLSMAVKGNGPMLLLPNKYKPMPHFTKTISNINSAFITWDFDMGYSTKKNAESLFFYLSGEACELLRKDLNNLNNLFAHHIPEFLFCQH